MKEYLKNLMNDKSEGEVILTCMLLIDIGMRMYEQEQIKKKEVIKSIEN